MADGEKIIQINIEDEMKSAYIDYSMSVIVSRALPDVRDGFKPVHRRVLYGMQDLGVFSNKPHKKSARIVGEVLGKYHPHGDSSVYDTMVRMAQPWSLRYPLVDGQGNFGSVDGDSPAAMRYTEARLRKIAEEMLDDLDKDTVDFTPNFDDSLMEPSVMPSKIPNLLINGASGIAVGMATNMAPHNLTEVIDGIIAYIDDNDIEIEDLLKYVKAPDFPTGAIIYGYEGVRDALLTGRGRIVMRAKAEIEEANGREQIIVTEIPYQVNKSELIKKTAELVNDKKIEGISDLRDESDRNGMRIVYEIKRDAIANVVLNKLYKFTALQTSFSVNNICLVDGRPQMLNLKDMIKYFVEFRHEVVIRRTKFELKKAEDRAHILEGLIIASDNIDEVIEIIKASSSPDDARERLMARFNLSDIQSRAIVDMRLRHLTGLEQDKLRAEYDDLMKLITDLKDVLDRVERRMEIIKNEMLDIRDKYGDERRSRIEYSASEMRMEDLIADEEVIITISHAGYIKRTSLTEFKVQNRGGMGSKGSTTRDKDFLEHLFVATNHNYLLIFTEKGRCFWMRVYEIPEGNKTAKGRAIQNLINIPQDDKVKAYVKVQDLTDKEYVDNNFIIMCSKQGIIKKTSLASYSRPRANGINAISIRENDELLEAKLTNGTNEIILATSSGRAIRFNESTVRPMGRNASGVKGVTLANDKDAVVGMICAEDVFSTILVVSEKGYGKRTYLNDPEDNEPVYRITNRGGKGVKTLNITDKTGPLMAIKNVTDEEDLMIITKSGITIRMHIDTIRTMGRAAQGVRLINLKGSAEIAAIARVPRSEEEDEIEFDEDGNPIEPESGTDIENGESENPDVE
ncbi:MAG: DNA gyrase subunit A [Crocinitomicaceae bacterium]|nr:DNA gyrase subunit A [Crocinitomicaceae bacterium]MCF8434410.1 DNA gyrase subunit A [Crocinitomicaceae bacterium]